LTYGSGTFGRSNGIERLQDEQRPAFNEPWHAEAYALVQVLIEAGRISPPEWAQAFDTALREPAAEGEPDSSDTYYAALSEALERVLVAGGSLQGAEVWQRINDWRAAYHRTLHGMPVRLTDD
jgi:nitrile hydratase accessory protein